MHLSELYEAIRNSWSKDTSYTPQEWSMNNNARGQCVVTALVIQDLGGGSLQKSLVTFEDGTNEKHYFNILSDGTEIDLTASQYKTGTQISQIDSEINQQKLREKLLDKGDTNRRYQLLKSRVQKYGQA